MGLAPCRAAAALAMIHQGSRAVAMIAATETKVSTKGAGKLMSGLYQPSGRCGEPMPDRHGRLELRVALLAEKNFLGMR